METQETITRQQAAALIRNARGRRHPVYRFRNMGCRSYVLGSVNGERRFIRVSLSSRTAPCVLRYTF